MIESDGKAEVAKEAPARNASLATARALVLVLAVPAGLVVFLKFGDSLSLEALATREEALRDLHAARPVMAMGAAFVAYVVMAGLSIPGATVLTLVLAWLLGFWRGIALVSFASTAGATVAFLLSRFVLRDLVRARFGKRLAGFNAALEREGAFYLFSLRLIPVVPFFVINLVMGLTPIRARTFWWVSQLGMLPGTAVYVYAGSQFPSLRALSEKGVAGILTPGLVAAFVTLGLFPLLVKKLMGRFRPGGEGV